MSIANERLKAARVALAQHVVNLERAGVFIASDYPGLQERIDDYRARLADVRRENSVVKERLGWLPS